MKNKLTGTLSLLFATVIWGFAFTAQSVGMEHLGPFTFQAIRCGLAVVFLVPLSLVMEAWSGAKAWAEKWKRRELWLAGLICGLALFVAASLQQIGLLTSDAGKAGFITAMYIVLVPLLGLLGGHRVGLPALAAVALAVAGLYLLSNAGSGAIALGDLCLMGCALAFAVQIRCIDRYAGAVDGLRLNCAQALVVTVLSLPFAALGEEIVFSNILACWQSLIFAGVFSMGVAYSLQILGQKHLSPTPASLIMSLESVFAALGGWWLLGQTMQGRELAGCALVFAGVIISQIPEKRIDH